MINDLSMQSLLWDRPTVLERLRKRGIPVAKSYVVLRGEDKIRAERKQKQSQDEIEAQSKKTKDNGQYYIEKARKEQAMQVPSPKSVKDAKQGQSSGQSKDSDSKKLFEAVKPNDISESFAPQVQADWLGVINNEPRLHS